MTMWTPEPRDISASASGLRPIPIEVASTIAPPPTSLNFLTSLVMVSRSISVRLERLL